MSQVKALLNQRLQKKEHSGKMAAMAKQTANGNLSTFSGIFSVTELNEAEKSKLEQILKFYSSGDQDVEKDLFELANITSEVKAITHQAAILHGERIKKAHDILIQYRDGAFTSWMIHIYGNRQTPYNLMQYYKFYEALPRNLRPQLEAMPRQVIYTLASREGALEKKCQIVENFKGETKAELLVMIREMFPLEEQDQRRQSHGQVAFLALKKVYQQLQNKANKISKTEKNEIVYLLQQISQLVHDPDE